MGLPLGPSLARPEWTHPGGSGRSPHRSQQSSHRAQPLDSRTSVCPRPQPHVGGQSNRMAVLGREEGFRLELTARSSTWTPMRPSETASI